MGNAGVLTQTEHPLYFVIYIVKLLHLCRLAYNLQNEDTRNCFGVKSICFKSPLSRMTSASAADLKKESP